MYILHFRSMRADPFKVWTTFTDYHGKPVVFFSAQHVADFTSGLDGYLFRRKRSR